MSYKKEKVFSLLGENFSNKSNEDLHKQFKKVLQKGMHGIGFSPYEENQEPGDPISEDQIRRRMEIIEPYTSWVRSFSCTEGNEMIPKIAKEYGLKTLVGAWLGTDAEKNEEEIQSLINLANNGFVDIAAVGNEVMYRKDLTEDALIQFIERVKKALPDIPVGYVDAYYEFEDRPAITEACDVLLANCYPYWEGCHIDYAFVYMKDMYHRAIKVANGKRVIISEAGWPNKGQKFYGAEPSEENAMKYFINTQLWSKEEDIEVFYFSSFDESWKTGSEGDVGAYWGLWDKDENLKY